MRLKTCWLNKSLIWSDIKRFWWLGVLNALATFFFGVFPVVSDMKHWVYARTGMPTELMFGYFFAVVFAVFSTARMFSYLNKVSSTAFCHAMPLSRKTQFVSHLCASAALSVMAGLINAVLFYIYRLDPVIAQKSPHLVLKFLSVYLIYSLCAISLTAFAQMLTGSSIACLFFTGAFVIIPLAVEGFTRLFLENHIYGYQEDYDWIVEKIFYLIPEKLLTWRCLIYFGIAALLLISAYFLYKWRPLENSGEVVAFRKLRSVFIYAVAVFAGMVSYLYFGSIFSWQIFYLLPFGLLGIVIAFMVSRKSFRIKGVQYPLLAFTAMVLLIYAGVRFDITGFEGRVPDADDVEYIRIGADDRVQADRYMETVMTAQGEERIIYPVYFDDVFETAFRSREDIDAFVALHSYMSQLDHGTASVNRPRYPEGVEYYSYTGFKRVYIEYHLKNGRMMRRQYWVNKETDKDYLEPVVTSLQYRAINDDLLAKTKKTITSAVITDERLGIFAGFEHTGNQQPVFPIDDESIDRIVEALTYDLQTVSYEDDIHVFERRDSPMTEIQLTIEYPVHNEEGKPEKPVVYTCDYPVWPFYTHTVSVLRELGLYEALPTAEDVEYISVFRDRDRDYVITDYYPKAMITAEDKGIDMLRIDDEEDIAAIYNTLDERRGIVYRDSMPPTITVRIVFKNNRELDVVFDLEAPDCPKVLKALAQA